MGRTDIRAGISRRQGQSEGMDIRIYGRHQDVCCPARGFVGGCLLGCRKSAKSVFQKFELAALRQRTFEKQRHLPEPKQLSHLLQSAPPICQLLGCAHRPVAESEQFEIVFNDAWQQSVIQKLFRRNVVSKNQLGTTFRNNIGSDSNQLGIRFHNKSQSHYISKMQRLFRAQEGEGQGSPRTSEL